MNSVQGRTRSTHEPQRPALAQRHLQILHGFAAKRAGGGITAPVLRTAEGVYDQSAAIVAYADEHLPEERRLYPAAPAERAEVQALEQRFDAVLGPEGRRWLHHEVLLSDGRRHLAGDRFSAADLAFAALAAPCVAPARYGTPLPQPEDMTPAMAAQVERWRAHAAGQYALRMFDEERPAPKVTSL